MKAHRGSWLPILLALSVACGAEITPPAGDEQQIEGRASTSDPWEGIFAVYPGGTGYRTEPVRTGTLRCPNGTTAVLCTVARISLAGTGLSAAQQETVRSRIDTEPGGEGNASVVLKGVLVRVTDHRTSPPTAYDELRASAVYQSPTRRVHAADWRYVSGYTAPWHLTVNVNATTLTHVPRELALTYRSRLLWTGPAAERPADGRVDAFWTFGAARVLPEDGGSFPPVEFSVDQIFYRLAP